MLNGGSGRSQASCCLGKKTTRQNRILGRKKGGEEYKIFLILRGEDNNAWVRRYKGLTKARKTLSWLWLFNQGFKLPHRSKSDYFRRPATMFCSALIALLVVVHTRGSACPNRCRCVPSQNETNVELICSDLTSFPKLDDLPIHTFSLHITESTIAHIPAGILNERKNISVMHVSFFLSFLHFSEFFCNVGPYWMESRCAVSIIFSPNIFGMLLNATSGRCVT